MDLLDTLVEIETRFWTHGRDYHDEYLAVHQQSPT